MEKFRCDALVWNEERGEVCYQIGEGCFIDQLCGQWHSILCGFKKPFDDTQAKMAVLSIYKNNYRSSMRDFVNPWRLFALNDEGGTVMCTYPEGARVPAIPIAYAEEVMSGFEYALAGLLMHYGYVEEAVRVVDTVRDRYDGKKRNPYNDTECGSNYIRSMAAFSLLPISGGVVADLPNRTLTLAPKTKMLPFRCPWFAATGWGDLIVNASDITIQVREGTLAVEKLAMPFVQSVSAVSVNGEVYTDFAFADGVLTLPRSQAFIECITIKIQ